MPVQVMPVDDVLGQQQLLPHGQGRHQAQGLEHQADHLAPHRVPRGAAQGGDLVAGDGDLARSRRDQSGDDVDEGGLAAARRPQEEGVLPLGNLERESVQNSSATDTMGKIVYVDQHTKPSAR